MSVIPNTRGNPQATDIAVETVLPFVGNASREDLQATLSKVDAEMSKLFEDRNILLTQGGFVTFTGTTITFTESLKLEINSQVAGGAPTVVDLGSTTRTLSANGKMVYAVVDRGAGTATVTDDSSTLPSVVAANQEVFLIAKRRDAGDGTQRCYFRNGMALNASQTVRLGASGSGGSGSGGGVNLIGMNASFQPVNTNDINAENSVGNWSAYADAASAAPADMTGGSPNVTITRTTTTSEILNGSGSFKITKDAANRQGEGISVLTNVPIGYRGKTAVLSMPFLLISGSLVEGDLKLYAYDVTNSQVLTPYNNNVIGPSGMLLATVDIPSTCAQIRVGYHFASTSTTAVTLSFDDVFLGVITAVVGISGSDWKAETQITLSAGFGTISDLKVFSRRVGDTLHVIGNFTAGTVAATSAYISLGTYIYDLTKSSTNTNKTDLGRFINLGGGAGGPLTNGAVFFDGSTTDRVFVTTKQNSNFTKENVDALVNTGNQLTFHFFFPVVGWSSNITMASSSTVFMSSYLSTGSRVTGAAPTLLGQYRSYLRNANAITFTETNASPGISPTSSDGIVIYTGDTWTNADANNKPSRYDVFIGKFKNFKVQYFSSTGRSGFLDGSPGLYMTGTAHRDVGFTTAYNAATGILTITRATSSQDATEDTHYAGRDENGGLVLGTAGTVIYFDIVVSENALAVGIQAPRSEVTVDTGNGHGSIATKIRRFSNARKQSGSAIFYADSSTQGGSFTILEDGVYNINYNDSHGAASTVPFGISVNAASLTANISNSTTYAQGKRAITNTQPTTNDPSACGWSGSLRAGDVVRAHTNGGISGTDDNTMFTITKVSN